MTAMQDNQKKVEHSYLSMLSDPSYLVNDDMVITWANEAFIKGFNLNANQVIGKLTCEETCPSQLCGTKNCPVAKAKRLKKGAEAEVLHMNNGKGASWFKSQATPMPENGSTLVTINDITKFKELQAKLHQMETDLNVIPTPIMEIDDKFTITFMNPAGAAVVGKTPDEVLGKKCYDLFKTPHCKTEKCACARAMKTDSVVTEQTIA
ncbi:MAG: PAS domain-containing protein, partial [Proteobacteria bacterium]|nr:PAS domain-containing protein [Pseudomonadota bacterium]